MNRQRIIGLAIAALGLVLSNAGAAAPTGAPDLVRARQLFFGIENVNATTGEVDNQQVIFSWIKHDPSGVIYRMSDAALVAAQ